MTTCSPVRTGEQFLSSLLGHVDCQAQTIGALGYQTLASPASPISPVLTALLTIFIALFGLRLMIGGTPRLATSVLSVAKIGVAITLATSWPAYSTVIYDVVVDAPAQLGAAIARPTGLAGANQDMVQRLQQVDNAMGRLTDLAAGVTTSSPKHRPEPRLTRPKGLPSRTTLRSAGRGLCFCRPLSARHWAYVSQPACCWRSPPYSRAFCFSILHGGSSPVGCVRSFSLFWRH